MANKKTTLKTQTGDNVYPNVLKENLPASTIFYDDEAAGPEGGVETPSGGSGHIAPTLNLLDLDSGELRTSITEEEKDNLEKGLYNQVMYLDGDDLSLLMPSKVLGDKSLDVNSFVQFYFDTNTKSITSLNIYGFNIGTKDPTTGNYPITIEKQTTIPIGSSGASIQSVDAYGEGGATTIEKGKIATDLTSVELKIPFVLNIYEDNTLSGVPTRIVMTNKFGENNYLGTLDFLNHYLVNVVKGTDGKYSYSSNIIPNPTKNTLFNKSILVPQDLEDPTPILPCTTADNGKVLSVVEGQAQWATPTNGGSEMHCYDVWYSDPDNEIYLTFFSNKTVLGLTQPKQSVSYKSMTDLPEFFPPVDTFPRIPCVGFHKDSAGNRVAVMTMEINNLPTSSLKGTWKPYSINGNLSVYLHTERKLTIIRRY